MSEKNRNQYKVIKHRDYIDGLHARFHNQMINLDANSTDKLNLEEQQHAFFSQQTTGVHDTELKSKTLESTTCALRRLEQIQAVTIRC